MTPEETREAAQLMLDWVDGKCEVEWGRGGDTWYVLQDSPGWHFDRYEYRRKPTPTPTYRPYTGEELAGMIGAEVKAVDRVFFVSVVTLRHDCVPKILLMPIVENYCERSGNPEWLMDHYTHIDGSPCGVEELE